MEKQMENLLQTERKPEVEEVVQFMEEMNPAEQQEFLVFIQGMRFVRGWKERNTTAAQPV